MGWKPCVSCNSKAPGTDLDGLDGSVKPRRKRRMGPLSKVVDHISSKLAFFPPRPATYQVRAPLMHVMLLRLVCIGACSRMPTSTAGMHGKCSAANQGQTRGL